MVTQVRKFIPKGFQNLKKMNQYDLNSWLKESHNYSLSSSNATNEKFELNVLNRESLLTAYAFEFQKFLLASIESKKDIPKNFSSYSWCMIKNYYSAFFASHALLRVTGKALKLLGPDDVKTIKTYGLANGINVKGGYYFLTYDDGSKLLKFELVKDEKSHEALWVKLLGTINDFAKSLNPALPEESVFYAQLSSLITVLTNSGSMSKGNWLSSMRNDTNYLSYSDPWKPLGKNFNKNQFDLSQKSLSWDKELTFSINHLKKQFEEARFLGASDFIVSMTRQVALDLNSISNEKKNFIKISMIPFM